MSGYDATGLNVGGYCGLVINHHEKKIAYPKLAGRTPLECIRWIKILKQSYWFLFISLPFWSLILWNWSKDMISFIGVCISKKQSQDYGHGIIGLTEKLGMWIDICTLDKWLIHGTKCCSDKKGLHWNITYREDMNLKKALPGSNYKDHDGLLNL